MLAQLLSSHFSTLVEGILGIKNTFESVFFKIQVGNLLPKCLTELFINH